MKLKILLPAEELFEEDVIKVSAEAISGSFSLLPRHVDFAAILLPGLLSCVTPEGKEVFFAVDRGVLVKVGAEVLVSTRNAVIGPDLGILRQTVEKQFRVLDEREHRARFALARLEADVVRRFIEMEESRFE